MAIVRLTHALGVPAPKRRSKYGATAVVVDGERFASKAEHARWETLRLRERIGEISNLRRQVVFPLEVNGVLVGRYTADAVYDENGVEIVEDSKGYFDTAAGLRIKIFEAIYGVKVRITGAAARRTRARKKFA